MAGTVLEYTVGMCWNTGVWEPGFGRVIQEIIPEPTPVVRLTQIKL